MEEKSSSPVGSFHDFARRRRRRRRREGDRWQRPAKRIYPAGGKMAVAVTTCCHFDTAARISFSRVIPTFIDDGSTRLRAIVPASIRNARFPLIYDRSEREREREREKKWSRFPVASLRQYRSFEQMINLIRGLLLKILY